MNPDDSQREADIGSEIAEHESLLDVLTLREVMLDRIGSVIGRITRSGEVTAFDYSLVIEPGEGPNHGVVSRPTAVVYVAMRHVLFGQPNLWSIRSDTRLLAVNAPDAVVEEMVRTCVEEVRKQQAHLRSLGNGRKP